MRLVHDGFLEDQAEHRFDHPLAAGGALWGVTTPRSTLASPSYSTNPHGDERSTIYRMLAPR
jgi:hypothetical protein